MPDAVRKTAQALGPLSRLEMMANLTASQRQLEPKSQVGLAHGLLNLTWHAVSSMPCELSKQVSDPAKFGI